MNQVEYCHTISELLRNIDTKTAKISNQQYSNQNLTAQQISILLMLDHQGTMRVSDLAKALNMVNSNVSAICSRLENMGFIERFRQKEDKRVVKIHLTTFAKDKMEGIKLNVAKFQDIVFNNVSEDDLKDIVLGLTKYNNLLDLALINENI